MAGAFAAAPPPQGWAQTSELIVVDELSGLAIGGFDPVAYFAEGRPALGEGDFEYRYAGAVWRFRNEGNRAAFIADPDVYAPVFGGYDPTSIAQGTATAGNPAIWAIKAQHLFLFYDDGARRAFFMNMDAVLERARKNWPDISAALVP